MSESSSSKLVEAIGRFRAMMEGNGLRVRTITNYEIAIRGWYQEDNQGMCHAFEEFPGEYFIAREGGLSLNPWTLCKRIDRNETEERWVSLDAPAFKGWDILDVHDQCDNPPEEATVPIESTSSKRSALRRR